MIQNGTKWESVPENISYEEAIITSSGTNLIATTPSKTITIVGSNKDKLKNYEGESVWIYQTETSDKNIFFAKDESNPENEVNILETPDDSWKDLKIISKINNYLTNYNPTCIVVINDNSIHQIGEYLYIYNHPFNKTAALAAGPMSFIEVEVKKIENPNSTLDPFKIIVEYAGKTFIPIEQHQVDLYRGFYPSHETFVGKKITLGFRPEDFYYTETPSEENNIEIKVKSIEEFESFNYIHFMLGSKEMIAKIPKNDKSNFYIGETINIHPDITRCKFFVINTNPYEEKNICEKIDAPWERIFTAK